MDEVFRALADSTRRSLLDELYREDGQTLTALEERFAMTRFGVMKHLKLLEQAGLVVTRQRGRDQGDLGDRAGRRLVPADGHPRPAPRGRERPALRRLADDPVRPEDLAGDR